MKEITIPVDQNGKPDILDGMKGKHHGEYKFPLPVDCPCCNSEGLSGGDSCETCDGVGITYDDFYVPWDVIKQIYQDMALTANKIYTKEAGHDL